MTIPGLRTGDIVVPVNRCVPGAAPRRMSPPLAHTCPRCSRRDCERVGPVIGCLRDGWVVA